MTGVFRITAILVTLILLGGFAYADLDKSLVKRQQLGKKPLDIAQSVSDGRLFVLLEGGTVQVMSPAGEPQERFTVAGDTISLEVSPDGQRVYLGNGKSNELQIFELSYVKALPVGQSAIKGAKNAPVTLTLFDDFQCPYCARLVPTLEKVLNAYPQQVRVVFKHFPLSMHKFARQAAVASIAARNQGKFWEMHDLLFESYNKLNDAKIREIAQQVGLNMKKFDDDIANPALQQEVNADMQLGTEAGVRGTPAVYVNGKQLKNRKFEGFKEAIDAELRRLKK